MKIFIADKFEKAGIDGLTKLGCEVVSEPEVGAEKLGEALARVKPDVLIVRSTKVNAAALAAASGLKGIIRAGAGVDNIDVPAATAKGIAVCNCPGMNAIAVAELAMAHLLTLDRRLHEQTIALRGGAWNKKDFAKARGLKGLTLGIVGMGAIGRELAVRARAFGMTVVGWSRSLTPESAKAAGVEFGGASPADLVALVARSDAISVHVAATGDTNGLISKAVFDAMKPGAYFINTARGSVVDEAAMIEAAKSKGLKLGLDVYQNQPGQPQQAWTTPVAAAAGASLTHHVGASTDQAQAAVGEETVRLVKVFTQSGRFENRVN